MKKRSIIASVLTIFSLLTTTSCMSKLKAEKVYIQDIQDDMLDKYYHLTSHEIIVVSKLDCYQKEKSNDFYYYLKFNLDGRYIEGSNTTVTWYPITDKVIYYKYEDKTLSEISSNDYSNFVNSGNVTYIDFYVSEESPAIIKKFDEE